MGAISLPRISLLNKVVMVLGEITNADALALGGANRTGRCICAQ
jgi:hypothetical protein